MSTYLLRVDELHLRFAALRLPAPDLVARLRSSIEKEGLRTPVLASTGADAGQKVLVDGFKRLQALRDLGGETVAASLLDLDAAACQAAILHCNAPHRGLADLEEAWIVQSLCRRDGLTQVTAGKLLQRHKAWVCRRLALAERLDADIQEDIRLGLLSATMARDLARLPRGNQRTVAQAARDNQLSSRQVAQLVNALVGAEEPAAKEALLADPLRYLASASPRAPGQGDPRLSVAANELRKRLLSLRGAAFGLDHSVRRHHPGGLDSDEAEVLFGLLADTLRASHGAVAVLQGLARDGGMLVDEPRETAHA